MMYNWQYKNWPQFEYDASAIDAIVLEFAAETGEVKGIIDSLPSDFQQETVLQFMIDEAIKTSEIEGEYYSRKDVMSSIKNRLGMGETTQIRDINAKGIAELMVKVREHFATPLTEGLLKDWHGVLFAKSRAIHGGAYRIGDEPMVIVSGGYGKEVVHYEAPPSKGIPIEMEQFVAWYTSFTTSPNNIKAALIKTAIAHLYFESIHPFEDGNGRIGRAIADKCLSESLGRPLAISLSTTIEQNNKAYYDALQLAQQSLEITDWIVYFCETMLAAQQYAKQLIRFTLSKAKFLDVHRDQLNERQLKVVLKMLDKRIEGFEGGMTAKKYMAITKTSKATATRDLQDLVDKEVFTSIGAGRGVRYELVID
ncbi:cell division protein Fic [Neptunitalea chrysea]|uniref:Cell division protein Fic n=1 Tax=Neptunitalea chrysea TaxID=1647581 RepID=A0A9W6B881_9FLAO|nr:Fic family protein [Neptunitalea chrysea]GLB53490.1 cell division protein Fic [Neptunitalea chrysea]